jgi:AraC family transcriptional regulator, arabinose operon regulatory protein
MHETSTPPLDKLTTGFYRMRNRYFAWREKGTSDWLLIFTVAGKGRFGHLRGEIVSQPGDIILIRPQTRHDYGLENTLRRWDLLWAHFIPRAGWFPLLNWPEEAKGLMRLHLGDEDIVQKVRKRFLEVNRLAHDSLSNGEAFAMNALEEVLLWCDRANPESKTLRLDLRVRRTLDYLYQNFENPISIPGLAKRSGLSTSRFAHLFREQVGSSPGQFLERHRLNQARQFLEFTQYSVTEIAYKVGFQNPFYFSLRFKQETGLSPRAYRDARVRVNKRNQS